MVMKIMQATIILAILDGTKSCDSVMEKQCVRSNFLMMDWLAVLWKMAQDTPEITEHVDFWSFKVRLTPEIKALITSINTDLVVIPEWLTSQPQVLDSAVSKSFKDH